MYQLIRLGNCVHVFDQDSKRFVKGSFTNIGRALGVRGSQTTRRQLLKNLQWVRCMDQHCKFQSCQKGDHWIGKTLV